MLTRRYAAAFVRTRRKRTSAHQAVLQNRAPVRGSCSPLLASRFAGVIAMALAHRPVPGVYDVPVVAVPSLRAPVLENAVVRPLCGPQLRAQNLPAEVRIVAGIGHVHAVVAAEAVHVSPRLVHHVQAEIASLGDHPIHGGLGRARCRI